MARTAIAITEVGNQGSKNPITYTAGDAANDHAFENTGREVLLVKNGATDVQVTVHAVPDEAGREVDIVATVSANTEALFGPFKPAWWNQRSGVDQGKIQVDIDDDTNVELAVFRLTHR